MDIHKPKPWHGWREFLREYLIIVVGVATALGGEQLVETVHWRHMAQTAREGMIPDLKRLLRGGGEREAESACLASEFAGLAGVLDRASETGRLERQAAVRSPARHSWSFNAYEMMLSGQVLPHLPADERSAMIGLYGWSKSLQSSRDIEDRDWSALRTMEGAGHKTGEAEVAALRVALSEATHELGLVRVASTGLAQQVAKTHFLSRAEIGQAWAQGVAEGRQAGACKQGAESAAAPARPGPAG